MGRRKKSARGQVRKAKDRWKSKTWYGVYAPVMFNKTEIGATCTNDPENLIGRTMEATMHELTGDFSKIHIKLKFKVNNISGTEAHTYFMGHSLTSDYIRRLTRRKRSKMEAVIDVTTKDGYLVRVKPLAMTEHRIQTSQKRAIRCHMEEVVKKFATENIMSEFIKGMTFGKLPVEIFHACKKVYPMKRIEIRKSEIIRRPVSTLDEGLEEEENSDEAEGSEGSEEEIISPETDEESSEQAEEELIEES